MTVSTVDEVRGFNRFYTRVLGLLRPKLVGSAFGLTEARVLYELAHTDQVAVTELRGVLDLDAEHHFPPNKAIYIYESFNSAGTRTLLLACGHLPGNTDPKTWGPPDQHIPCPSDR